VCAGAMPDGIAVCFAVVRTPPAAEGTVAVVGASLTEYVGGDVPVACTNKRQNAGEVKSIQITKNKYHARLK